MSAPSIAENVDRFRQAIASLGFVHERGWTWRRDAGGRHWTLTVMPQRRTKYYGEVRRTHTQGWRVRLDVSTRVPVRAYAVVSGFARNALVRRLYAWRGLERVALATDGGAFTMVTSDAAWVRQLLTTPDGIRAFDALTESRDGLGQSSSVYFEPESLHYSSPLLQGDEVTAARLEGPVAALEALARVAEAMPPPARPRHLTARERWLKQHPYAAAGLLLGGLVFGIGAISLLIVGAVIAVVLLSRAG